jgi:phosphopentomutase
MRIVAVVVDSGGIGAAPDAEDFGDAGANTISHALAVAPTPLPHLAELGLGLLTALSGTPAPAAVRGAARRMHPRAAGKDTLAGHWEMMGHIVTEPFRTYPDGFPPEVVAKLETAFGRPLLGNRPASGTVIIEELGPRHLETGHPIVYTSADSVLQIAAHEEVVPVEQLYAWCRAARAIMTGPHLVGRIIARPFTGPPGHFVRTARRHDFAVAPPPDIYPVVLAAAGVDTVAVGKIGDIFSGQGFRASYPTRSNRDGLERTLAVFGEVTDPAFVFVNLVDFDSRWGHRRDPAGYVQGLKELDAWIPEMLGQLRGEDALWITADHGCDPTMPGSDHTREDSPWLIGGPAVQPGLYPPSDTLADLAATLASAFSAPAPAVGRSRWEEVSRRGLS